MVDADRATLAPVLTTAWRRPAVLALPSPAILGSHQAVACDLPHPFDETLEAREDLGIALSAIERA